MSFPNRVTKTLLSRHIYSWETNPCCHCNSHTYLTDYIKHVHDKIKLLNCALSTPTFNGRRMGNDGRFNAPRAFLLVRGKVTLKSNSWPLHTGRLLLTQTYRETSAKLRHISWTGIETDHYTTRINSAESACEVWMLWAGNVVVSCPCSRRAFLESHVRANFDDFCLRVTRATLEAPDARVEQRS